jgi:hypothetical protein
MLYGIALITGCTLSLLTVAACTLRRETVKPDDLCHRQVEKAWIYQAQSETALLNFLAGVGLASAKRASERPPTQEPH